MPKVNALRLLAVARIIIGALFVVRTTALANALPIPLAHVDPVLLGWPSAGGTHFAELGLVLPGSVVGALAVARTAAGVLFLLGIRARSAGIAASLSACIVQSQEPFLFFYTLEVLYVGVALLALADSATCLALRPDAPRSPETSLMLIRGYAGAVYGWAAIAKLHGEWLDGHVLSELLSAGIVAGFAARRALSSPLALRAAAVAIPLVEALLGAGLQWARTRRAAVVCALLFHVALEEAVHPDVIGLVMGALLVPCWVRNSDLKPS
jgi:hypothetical protein